MQNPLHVVLAIDSFKGSATSLQAETWVSAGIKCVEPNVKITNLPIADGGEGTVAALTEALHGKVLTAHVTGPLGKSVTAQWGSLPHNAAVIEMAQASGLHLSPQTPSAAMQASTYGVGELIRMAIEQGATTIYVGLGGSATTDGGIGMARALGYEFYDQDDQPIASGAAGLATLTRIDDTQHLEALDQVSVIMLSDVLNPLAGDNGAAMIYGGQKGLTVAQRQAVDLGLQHFGKIVDKYAGQMIQHFPGAGAAGGLGAGLLAFTHAQNRSGIDTILQLARLNETLANADLVITGEGHLDAQSLNGKAPIGIAHAAKKYGLPVIAIVGAHSDDLEAVYQQGIDAVLAIGHGPQSLVEAVANVKSNLMATGATVMRMLLLGRSLR
ncbi:glycerate kinase [Lacticaseibacillus porcinae]|uniref:glycerate kinase family protein n=1 Tax=Lacticaseibacillus porcinae TaxID=1123687 RepID=UPI000F7BACF1|nr:glycerate kinase [Lacticaseibacillus porcinae]